MDKSENEKLLSVCLIVKNEEKFLGQCLESVKDVADEIIVVDTGSTDKTVSIAESFGAKVFYHKWDGDFAKARNVSLDNATGKWLLILDADEKLESAGIPLLKKVITANPELPHGFSLKIYNYFDIKSQIKPIIHYLTRLIQNRPNIRYTGKLHEQIKFSDTGKPININLLDLVIHHYGYDPTVVSKKDKGKRNTEILIKAIEEEPENWFHRHNYGVSLFYEDKFFEALEQFYKAEVMAEKKGERAFDSSNFYYQALIYYSQREPEKCIDYCKKCFKLNDNYYDVYFIMGQAYFLKQDYEKGIEAMHRATSDQSQRNIPTSRVIDTGISEWKAINEISAYYINKGEYDKAGNYLKKIERHKDQDPVILLNLIYVSIALDDINSAEKYYFDLRGIFPDENRRDIEIDYIKYLWGKGEKQRIKDFLNKYIKELKKPQKTLLLNTGGLFLMEGHYEDALNIFLTAVEIDPEILNQDLALDIANCCSKLKRFDEALNYLCKSLELNPENPNIHNDIAVIYMNNNDLINASKHLVDAIKYKPDYNIARYNLGKIDYHLKNYERAMENFEILFSKNEYLIESLMFMAGILYNIEKYGESIIKLNKVIEIQPNYLEAYEYLIKNYRKLEKNELADQLEKNLNTITANLKPVDEKFDISLSNN